MKKINRIIILVLCIYLAICQINKNIYSYTEEEIKNIIQYKTVEEDGEPKNYDLEIDASNLKSDAKIPVIQASFDYVLYGNGAFSNINFLGLKDNDSKSNLKYTNLEETSKNNKRWTNLSNLAKNFLRVSLYIATASLLTLLIYFAVVIVKRSISNNGVHLPGENLSGMLNSYGSVDKSKMDKMLLEQWIKSVGMMAIIIVIINIVISFSNMMIGLIIKGEVSNPITVYVKSNVTTTEGIPDLPDDLENLQAKDLFPMGDIAYDHTDQPEGQEAMDYIFNTIGSLVNIAHAKYPMKKSLVIMQVVNESGWVSSYDDGEGLKAKYNNILGLNAWGPLIQEGTTWWNKGQKTVTVMMPHGGGSTPDPAKVFDNLYDCIEDYMGQFCIRNPEQTFGDYNKIENYEAYIHAYTPTEDAKKDMYIYYRDKIQKYNLERFDNMPDTPVGTKGTLKASYFNTNLEGVYMLEAQYDWENNFLHNLMYIVCGFCLTLFKWFCFFIFLVRVVLVAFLIAIAPITIIIHAVQKVKGNNGLLNKWLIVYVYAVLLKPALGIIYYIMTKLNIRLVADNPFFIILVIVVMYISFKISLSKVMTYITNKRK